METKHDFQSSIFSPYFPNFVVITDFNLSFGQNKNSFYLEGVLILSIYFNHHLFHLNH